MAKTEKFPRDASLPEITEPGKAVPGTYNGLMMKIKRSSVTMLLKTQRDASMNTQLIISSLRIKRLFGLYDFSVDFRNLTVIVGKNGLGKTTILKIISGLITGNNLIDCSKICESIELVLGDGHSICYGDAGESFINTFTKTDIEEFMLENKAIKSLIKATLEKNPESKNIANEDFVNSIISSLAANNDFLTSTRNKIVDVFNESKELILVNKQHRKKLNNKINVRYISTVNISANAGNKMDLGNSIERNILDLAIYEELRLLMKNGSDEVIEAFKTQLTPFLNESGKSARLDHGEWSFITDSGHMLRLDQLSSGERQLVYILATAANTCGKPTLFLMDEPEVSLHLSWQEKIIDAIMNINHLMQIIAVTHSPGIIMNGHMDAYVEMKDILQVSGNV